MAIYWYKRMVANKRASPNYFTLNALLKIFSKEGDVDSCEQIVKILQDLGKCNEFTCFYLVNAWIKKKNLEKALEVIMDMNKNNIIPTLATYASLLKEATVCKNVIIGTKVLELINKNNVGGEQLSIFIVSFLLKVNMASEAIEECSKMKKKGFMNVVSWNCLIQAYIQMNDISGAIKVIDEMAIYNTNPNSTTFTILMKACANLHLYEDGIRIHQTAMNMIKGFSIELSNSIISFYTKCGHPEIAIEEFDKMKKKGIHDVVSWNCLIQAYIQMNDIYGAIKVIDEMAINNINTDSTTFTILMKACANLNLYEDGRRIHQTAMNMIKGFSIELTTAVIGFYTKCGHPEIAIEEFDKMKKKGIHDVVSWNCLIQAYIQMNDIYGAIKVIDEMVIYNTNPNSTTFNILLTACANLNLYEDGRGIHQTAMNMIKGFSVELNTAVISFYTKCGHPEIAIEEFDKMKKKGIHDVVLWNCLIQAYIQMNDIYGAIKVIDEMAIYNTNPNSTTFNILLTACANLHLYEDGRRIHQTAMNMIKGFSIELSNSIISFYTKCGNPEIAIEEFDKMKKKGLLNVVSWNCLIQAYIQMNDISGAIKVIDEMVIYNTNPNSTTFNILLTACANLSLYEDGRGIHQTAMNMIKGFSIELSNSIISFYTKCGHPEIAIEEFDKMKKKGLLNVVSWNCLIQAYINNNLNEAIFVFQEMKKELVEPNIVTYIILLTGCGEYVAAGLGKKLIEEIQSKKLEIYEEISSAMMYFYSRIGEKEKAQDIFNKLNMNSRSLSIITFNNMLACYAHHGQGKEAQKLFNEMIEKKIPLSDQTYTIILNAYSHSGMVEDAVKLFEDVKLIYGQNISPFTMGAMVDVFARAGRFKEAELIINGKMDFVSWNTVLGACRKYNNVEFGERAFKILNKINKNEASPYVLLSNIYTFVGEDKKAEKIRRMMEKNGISKTPGIVYHEENGKVYRFISGCDDYERYEEVERMRDEIYSRIIKAGFEPDIRWVTNTKLVTEKEKLASLCRHAEKTAIAHALVLNPTRKSIILTKNLRVCNDCHAATEFISKVMNIEIIVRDANRYHHFQDGKCSCDGYW